MRALKFDHLSSSQQKSLKVDISQYMYNLKAMKSMEVSAVFLNLGYVPLNSKNDFTFSNKCKPSALLTTLDLQLATVLQWDKGKWLSRLNSTPVSANHYVSKLRNSTVCALNYMFYSKCP